MQSIVADKQSANCTNEESIVFDNENHNKKLVVIPTIQAILKQTNNNEQLAMMEKFIICERERSALKCFYQKMNDKSKQLNLSKATNWAVSHGMHHDYNYSSAIDVATVSWNVMRTHTTFS